ncbi:MAG TPA: PAS domain S-box protein, partial [Phycisphaerales bacterium]|nr:PAS domain S-box protein [Phycisphaerales bacterium]
PAVTVGFRAAGAAESAPSADARARVAAPPDLGTLASLVHGEQQAAMADLVASSRQLFAHLDETLTRARELSAAMAEHDLLMRTDQARFSDAMLRLRSKISRADGRARLAAVRARGEPGPAGREPALQPLLVEALELGLLVKDLEGNQDEDAVNDAVNNHLEPSLERLLNLASTLDAANGGDTGNRASGAGSRPDSWVAAARNIAVALRGDGDSGIGGILKGYQEGRDLRRSQRAVQEAGSASLNLARGLQEQLRAIASDRTATVRGELRKSLNTAIWRAGSASIVGMLVLVGLAVVLAGSAGRRVSDLAESVRAQRALRATAEGALRESRTLWAAVTDHFAVTVTDGAGVIIEANDAFCTVSGHARDELLGRDHRIVSSGTHPGEFWAGAWRAISSGQPWRAEVCNRAKDGTLFWSDTTITPFRGADGTIEKFVAIRMDITARKEAERRLAESERRLRTIIDAEPECVKLLSPDGVLLEMNPAGLAMLEAESVAQVRSLTLKHFVLPEHHAAYADVHARVSDGQAGTIAFEVRGLKGTRRWLDAHVVPMRDGAGNVEAILAVTRDITERRRADEAMRNAEAFLRSAIDSLDSHTVVLGSDGRILSVNRAWREFALANGGTGRDVLEGADYLAACDQAEAVCPEAGRIAAAVRDVLSGEAEPAPIEYACNSPTENRWFLCSIRGFSREQGRFAVVSHLNITTVKRAEEALRHMGQVQEEMGRTARIGGWELDSTTGKVVWTSEIYRIFELPATYDPTLDSSLSFFPEESRKIVAGHVRKTIETGEPFDYTVAFTTPSGRNLWVRGIGKAERRADGTMRLYGAFQDVTESYLARQELVKARDAAQAASRAKSEFLANMSHEIRTPLTAILGFTDLLAEDGDLAAAPASRVQTVNTIKEAGKHLLTVINDILDISKIEADRMAIERIETHIPKVLHDVESLMRSRATGKGITLRVALANLIPERVLSDPTRLRQILMNLVGNAVKFTERGGVTITAGMAELGGSEEGSRLVFDVEDTGAGMTEEQVARVFSPFGQADSSVTRRFGGTGLGLTISRRLASLMGGDVKLIRTEPGKGSCFRLVIPMEPVAGSGVISDLNSVQTAGPPKATAPAVALRGRILLAEDGPDNQRLIAFHLRRAGAEVEVADNGKIALMKFEMAEAAGKPFDLLVSDMQMPEMDGYTLARTLRERGSTIPIVALTAHAMAEDKDRCLDAGCDDYSTKPIDKALLLATCAAWMGKASGVMLSERAL